MDYELEDNAIILFCFIYLFILIFEKEQKEKPGDYKQTHCVKSSQIFRKEKNACNSLKKCYWKHPTSWQLLNAPTAPSVLCFPINIQPTKT